ncbi:MAG: phage major capsid protein, partial [Dehalococcoidia bacterium]
MPNEIQDLQRSIADVQGFIKDRYDPITQDMSLLRQEQDRLAQQVRGVLESQRRSHLNNLLRKGSNLRPTVRGGKYDGMGPLELAICSSLQDAHRRELHGYDAARLTMLKQWQANLEGARRALDSSTAGAGDELVPTEEAAQLWADVNLATAVVSLFPGIQMPTNPFDIPLQLGDMNFYPGTANVAAKSTDPNTSKQTMTAYELTAALAWAYELDEDAAIAMLPELRASLVRNSAENMDDVVLNADTTTTNNINADGATITATDAGKAQWLLGFNGLRHIPLVDNTAQGNSHGAAVSDDMFNEIRAKLGRYGIRPSEAAFVTDVNTYIRAQSVANFRTIDKLGPQATLLT